MSFKQFNFHQNILESLLKAGYEAPTPIQEKAIPLIIEKKDLRASAQTGTGKTAAFVLPALQMLIEEKSSGRGPRVLILAPTRELAMQVANEAQKYSSGLGLKIVCIFGGVPYPEQNRQLQRPYDILVATPGRLIDHLGRRRIDLRNIQMLVLDEADRMLDMGFIEPVEHIVSLCPEGRQTLLFSATLSKQVMRLSEKLLKDPVEVVMSSQQVKHENIDQQFKAVDNIGQKHKLLEDALNDPEVKQMIVFTATKRTSEELADQLSESRADVDALHGDMNQRQRTRTIQAFRKGKTRILVATDVAARGIDVAAVSHVINFDIPSCPEDYVHRIGRTGRAGSKGTALSFVSRRDINGLREIEKYTGQLIPLYKDKNTDRKGPKRFAGRSKRFFPRNNRSKSR